LLGLARLLSRTPPPKGRVILLFQPAEEIGSGAAAVTADPRFHDLIPDYAFALHNMPDLPLGQANLAPGPFACASRGLKITLTGKTAHASLPHTGTSPAQALADLIPALQSLGPGGPDLTADFRLITITHARLGAPAFGIAPGEAELWATLRTPADAPMTALHAQALQLATTIAHQHSLHITTTDHDIFTATINDPHATHHLARALDALNIPHHPGILPMRASEDFGRFAHPRTELAMLLLGAGPGPALHNPDYDFNDALIPIGTRIFHRTITSLLG
ncbi:MAG: M20/M25/M40 family metallo-hydrolase, partial [Paracoccaceae bacterium]